MRDFIRQFLLYSRSERRAVIALAILIVIAAIAPPAYHFFAPQPHITGDTTLQHDIALWQKEDNDSDTIVTDVSEPSSAPAAGHALFYFDPNTIGVEEWQKLGLTEKQAAGIEKYKSKGGHFHTADDLRRMYSLTDADKARLMPYVRIADAGPARIAKGGPDYIIEINAADTTAYQRLWGIGPVKAGRIVKYREQLGGFTRIEQIGEVRDISDSLFMSIRPHLRVDPTRIHQININEADFETLKKHPYIHTKIARAITAYRDSNGKFEKLEQLKQFKAVTDDVYTRILPYLTL